MTIEHGALDGPLLRAQALTKSYRRGSEIVRALRDVGFELLEGEVVGLMGPSGSGKTTLLNILCGWEHPDAGVLWWMGTPISSPAKLPWHDVAVVPQDLALIEELSVAENVELPLRLARRLDSDGRAAARALIDDLGLTQLAARSPSEASLGEQQRTALARALVLRPRLLLADEPSAHQDEQWATGVMEALRRAAAGGTTCLLATHSHEAMGFLDRVLAIRDGVLSEPVRPRSSSANLP